MAQALVTGPGGKVAANNENEDEEFVITTIDLSMVDRVRARKLYKFSFLNDRRPEVYGELGAL